MAGRVPGAARARGVKARRRVAGLCLAASTLLGACAFAATLRGPGSGGLASGGARSTRLARLGRAAAGEAGEGGARERIRIEDLQPGQELNGIVSSLAPFGAFVDVGADRDGMVHVSKVASGYVGDIEAHVEPGQAVKVWVVDVSDDGKLNLSMLSDDEDFQQRSAKDYAGFEGVSPDLWLEGTVQDISDFGVWVTVSPPDGGKMFQGLVHISQIKDGFVDHPAREVEVGQTVKVRVLSFDSAAAKLRLTMRGKTAAPASKASARSSAEDLSSFGGLSPSQWIPGKVHHLVPFGIFVEVDSPDGKTALGLVHVTQIRDGFVEDPANEVEVDQEVKVRVLRVDPVAGRMSLSMKPPDPEG